MNTLPSRNIEKNVCIIWSMNTLLSETLKVMESVPSLNVITVQGRNVPKVGRNAFFSVDCEGTGR